MLNRTTKYLRGLAAGIVGIALLVLVLLAASCGKSTEKEDVIVRLPQRHTSTPPMPVLPLETAVDTAATTPEVQVAETQPQPTQPVTYEEAEAAFSDRRYDEAVTLFTAYTERKSENPWGFYMLGLSARMTHDFDTAEEAFRSALDLDPNHVKSLLNLSRVLLDTDRADIALVKVDEALGIDPESGDGYRLRGRALRQLGRKNDAMVAYRHAIVLNDQDVWSMNNMALMLIEEGLFEDALPPLARAIELEEHPVFLNNLGMALEGTGRFRAAEVAYRSAVGLDDSYENAGSNLARIELVAENPGIEPIDLATLSQKFSDDVRTWEQAMAPGSDDANRDIASMESASDAGTGDGDAGSTGSEQQ
jgi:Flp pilus assembly protein TadD